MEAFQFLWITFGASGSRDVCLTRPLWASPRRHGEATTRTGTNPFHFHLLETIAVLNLYRLPEQSFLDQLGPIPTSAKSLMTKKPGGYPNGFSGSHARILNLVGGEEFKQRGRACLGLFDAPFDSRDDLLGALDPFAIASERFRHGSVVT